MMEFTDWVPIIFAIFATGGVTSIVIRLLDKDNQRASTADLITSAGERIIKSLEEVIKRLEEEKDVLLAERAEHLEKLREFQDNQEELIKEIHKLNIILNNS